MIITEQPLSALIAEHGTLDEQRVDTRTSFPQLARSKAVLTVLYCNSGMNDFYFVSMV